MSWTEQPSPNACAWTLCSLLRSCWAEAASSLEIAGASEKSSVAPPSLLYAYLFAKFRVINVSSRTHGLLELLF